MMKTAISVLLFGILLFFSSCNLSNSKEQIQEISEQEVNQLPQNIDIDSTSFRLVKSGSEFPIPFVTYIPVDFANYNSKSEDGDIILFKYRNQAGISLTVLPKEEFSNKKKGVAYVKELLSLIAEDVKLQEDGFYRGKSLGRYQNAKVEERNGYIYYWLLDAPFELKDEMLETQALILDEFLWVK